MMRRITRSPLFNLSPDGWRLPDTPSRRWIAHGLNRAATTAIACTSPIEGISILHRAQRNLAAVGGTEPEVCEVVAEIAVAVWGNYWWESAVTPGWGLENVPV